MSDEKKLRTRCYYTEYVNHMIRFYLSCPDSVRVDAVKRRADVENWISVQAVLHLMPEADRVRLIDVFHTSWKLPVAVTEYCQKTGADETEVWKLITKTCSSIARQRGLI